MKENFLKEKQNFWSFHHPNHNGSIKRKKDERTIRKEMKVCDIIFILLFLLVSCMKNTSSKHIHLLFFFHSFHSVILTSQINHSFRYKKWFNALWIIIFYRKGFRIRKEEERQKDDDVEEQNDYVWTQQRTVRKMWCAADANLWRAGDKPRELLLLITIVIISI